MAMLYVYCKENFLFQTQSLMKDLIQFWLTLHRTQNSLFHENYTGVAWRCSTLRSKIVLGELKSMMDELL